MKHVLLTLAVLTMAAPALAQTVSDGPQTSAAGTLARVAYFSPQRAFAESADGKAALTRLSSRQAEQERVIAEKNKALETAQQALDQGSTLLSEPALLERSRNLERLKIDLQRTIEDAEAELTAIQREIRAAFMAKLTPAIEQVATERGLQFVLNADDGTIVWADRSFDITTDVVQRLAQAK
jgi:Skp family chaperone for outer membrane proteins